MLPGHTAPHSVPLSCGHQWWSHRGWRDAAEEATTHGASQIWFQTEWVISMLFKSEMHRISYTYMKRAQNIMDELHSLTTQNSLWLALMPALKLNGVMMFILGNSKMANIQNISRKKSLTHQALYSSWTDQWLTWTCNRPAHQGTMKRTCFTILINIKTWYAAGLVLKHLASCLIPTDLCPLILDTLTMEPLVSIRWGTQSWVRWYTDLEDGSKVRGHFY